MRHLEINTDFTAEGVVAYLSGELDAKAASDLNVELISIMQLANAYALVLECSGLEYVSSAGMGELLSLAKTCKEAGIKLILCQLQPQVQQKLVVTGMIKRLTVAHTVEEAFQMGASITG
ncbi:MAG: STAS domain-containing protein [Hymenobacteraceae bacterium]|nr:STAS domain-containing protein [Hymenobacteraceae bacterium]MDX5480061.1 STAS domain-containing protein [Hymenobacteraceae bacterium]